MLELYHWEPNTAFLKPLIVLHEKGVAFTSRYIDFSRFEQYDLADFNGYTEVQHNPDGEGPILFAGGLPMTEAFFLTLYLDEKYPDKPLRPADAYGRWNVLKWARFLNEVPGPAVATLGCHKYLVPQLKAGDRAAIDAGIAKVPTRERKDAWLAALNNSYTDELLADSRRKLGIAVKQIEDALDEGRLAPWVALFAGRYRRLFPARARQGPGARIVRRGSRDQWLARPHGIAPGREGRAGHQQDGQAFRGLRARPRTQQMGLMAFMVRVETTA